VQAERGVDLLRVLERSSRAVIAEEEKYLESRVRALAPSVAEICGPKLAAQLIELAGGLRELAMKPSSTVQVLGAEKAMFRHLRGAVPPPKHGVIFQHPTVQFAPKKERGKASRKLAARIVMAARKDAFGGGAVHQ
jgi:nucleolar protein 56